MVTEAGKELLRNSINTANFHNKILEQNEMWKQFEIERGLTMMVSDDDILKKIRNHRCSKHQKMAEAKERSKSNSSSKVVAGTSSGDRWDHSGFLELYPEGPKEKKLSSSSKEHSKRWGHSGFHQLYPDAAGRERSSSASSSSRGGFKKTIDLSSGEEQEGPELPSGKKWKKKFHHCKGESYNVAKERGLKLYKLENNSNEWGHSGFRQLYPDAASRERSSSASSSSDSSRSFKKTIDLSSDEEQEGPELPSGKKCKKKRKEKKKQKKKRRRSEASTSDNEIYQEFKEFKRKRKSEKEKLKHTKRHKEKFQ